MKFTPEQIERMMAGEDPRHEVVCYHGYVFQPLKDEDGYVNTLNLRMMGHVMSTGAESCGDMDNDDAGVPDADIRVTDYPVPLLLLDEFLNSAVLLRMAVPYCGPDMAGSVGMSLEQVMDLFAESMEENGGDIDLTWEAFMQRIQDGAQGNED